MIDYTELMRRAKESTGIPDVSVAPDVLIGLIADLDEARNGMKHSCAIRLKKQIEQLETERDQLKSENEALRKDAERYRWLRNDMNDVAITFSVHSWEDLSGEFMDSAIDAAMSQGEKP